MALQKAIEQETGVIATYHNISDIQYNKRTNSTIVYVESFLDKDARDSQKSRLTNIIFPVSGEVGFLNDAYVYLKTLPEMAGAEDA